MNNDSNEKFYVDYPFKNPAIISIAPGLFGLEHGLHRAIGKTRTVAYVEIEAFIVENIIFQMEKGVLDAAPLWTDAKTFDPWPFRNKVHGITAGYPCQPFSVAGKRGGEEDYRHLWPSIRESVKAINPVFCFFENVHGHLSLGFGEVYRDLSDMGYAVEPGVFTAEEVGAPHERKRLFILAISKKYLSFISNANSNDGRKQKRGLASQQEYRRHLYEMEKTIRDWKIKKQTELANTNSKPGQSVAPARMDMEWSLLYQTGWKKNTNSFKSHSSEKYKFDYPVSRRCEQCNPQQFWIQKFNKGCKELAHTNSPGLPKIGITTITKKQKNNRIDSSGAEISNTMCSNVQREEQLYCKAGWAEPANLYCWPARPGEKQYSFEHPRVQHKIISVPSFLRKMGNLFWKNYNKIIPKEDRQEIKNKRYSTIEPILGSTIDGYQFREDLLRSLGNKVVQQTSEFAFIILLEKHLKNIYLQSE